MVKTNSSLGKTGLYEWLLQRITAVIIGLYILFISFYILSCSDFSFTKWSSLFDNLFIKFFTLLTVFSIVYHAWIGMWTVSTDYIKPTFLRLSVQFIIKLVLGFCLLLGFVIVH